MDNLEQSLPPGGVPSDVADDVLVKASENEFIIPANVVRFIGLEKLESMVQKANTKLQEMEGAGRIGGKKEGDEILPEFAEGGLVSSPTQTAQESLGLSFEEYKNPDGSTIVIPVMNGKPLMQPPQGSVASGKASGTLASQAPATAPTAPSGGSENDRAALTGTAKDVSQWGASDFNQMANAMGTNAGRVASSAMKTLGAIAGLGNIVGKAQDRKFSQGVEALDQALTTGVLNGQALSPTDRASLQTARARIDSPETPGLGEKLTGLMTDVVTAPTGNILDRVKGVALGQVKGAVKGRVDAMVDPLKDQVKDQVKGALSDALTSAGLLGDKKLTSSGIVDTIADALGVTEKAKPTSPSAAKSTGLVQRAVSGENDRGWSADRAPPGRPNESDRGKQKSDPNDPRG